MVGECVGGCWGRVNGGWGREVGEGVEGGWGHRRVYTLHGWGRVVGQGLGRCEEGELQKGMHPTWGLVNVERGSLRGEVFERLSRDVRGDGLACKGTLACFLVKAQKSLYSNIWFKNFNFRWKKSDDHLEVRLRYELQICITKL